MAILTTSGIPSDNTGSAQDYAIDPVAHIIWGPKTSTWVGTANSLNGPSGPGLVYGQGAPTNAQGAIGQGYLDLTNGNFYGPKASNGAWGNAVSKIQGAPGTSALTGAGSPVTNNVLGVEGQSYLDTSAIVLYVYKNGGWGTGTSLVGPQGTPGPTYLTGFSAGIGPYGLTPAGTAFSSTPYVVPLPGTTTPSTFTPIGPSALMGLYAYASVAVTLTLYNVTAGASVYSVNLAAGQTIGSTYFAPTQYPLNALSTYQWQVTGAASGIVQLEPFYLMPANTPGVTVQICQAAGYSTNTTFSSTLTSLPVYGGTSAQGIWAHAPPRTGGVYSAQATYWPASGTPATASVKLTLYYGAFSNGAGGAVGFNFAPVTATGLPQTLLPPQLTDLSSLAVNNYFYWRATGTGTGTLSVQLMPLV